MEHDSAHKQNNLIHKRGRKIKYFIILESLFESHFVDVCRY